MNGRVSLTQRVPAGEVRADRDIFAYPLGTDAADARRGSLRARTTRNGRAGHPTVVAGIQAARRCLGGALDGARLEQLTNFRPELDDAEPSWSADGKRDHLSLQRGTCSGEQRRHLGDERGTARTGAELVKRDEGDERYPSMSPDGTRCCSAATGTGSPATVTRRLAADADGSGVARLTSTTTRGRRPDWSPDGKRIALPGPGRRRQSGDLRHERRRFRPRARDDGPTLRHRSGMVP